MPSGDVMENIIETKKKMKPKTPSNVWASHTEYIMAGMASAIGLGNVWRFPLTAYQNGGGAFLIPYSVVLLVVARPMYYAECFIGQFGKKTTIAMWSAMSPIMAGAGYASALACFYVVSYYSAITALCLFYLGQSFQFNLPWAYCDPSWGNNTPCMPSSQRTNVSIGEENTKSSAELYFTKSVLHEAGGMENGIGMPSWYLSICLFIVWLIIFLVVSNGVKSRGKAAYFLAISPYVTMLVLLVSTLNLEGSLIGVSFFFTPDWKKIFQIKVWYAATTQVFFSFGISVPSNIGTASFNNFKVDIYKDALMITILDAISSLLSGIVIFGILGNLSHVLKVDIRRVIGRSDLGLFFVTYPDAVMKTRIPQVFSVIFFFTMSTIGVSTSALYFHPINDALRDAIPKFPIKNISVSAILCSLCFGICLIYVTPSGQCMISLVDHYGGTFLVLACCFAECIGIFWVYGIDYFCRDIEFTLNRSASLYWRLAWGILIPGLMVIMFLYAIATYDQLRHGDNYEYPLAAYVSGNLMVAIGAMIIPVYFLSYALRNSRKKGISIKEAIHRGTYCRDDWGPQDPEERKQWKEYIAAAGLHREHRSYLNHMLFILTGNYNHTEIDKIKEVNDKN